MKCEIIQDLLPLYVDDICSSVTKEAIEQHLQTCEDCRKKEKELRSEFIVEVKETVDMDKKEILIKREKAVITAVNERVLRIAAKFDMVVTSIVLVFLFSYSIQAKGVAMGIVEAIMSTPDGFPAGWILGVLLIFDAAFLVNDRKNKDTFVSGSLVVLSIVLKAMVGLIMLIYLAV